MAGSIPVQLFPGFTRDNIAVRAVQPHPHGVLVHETHPTIWVMRLKSELFRPHVDHLRRDRDGYVLISPRAFAVCVKFARQAMLPKVASMEFVLRKHGYTTVEDHVMPPAGCWKQLIQCLFYQ